MSLTAGPEAVRAEAKRRGLKGMPLHDQMRLQLAFLKEALAAVGPLLALSRTLSV